MKMTVVPSDPGSGLCLLLPVGPWWSTTMLVSSVVLFWVLAVCF